MPNSRHSILSLFTLLVIGLIFSVSLAQESVNITVYVDSDSFTIVVPANAGISLENFGFLVVRNGSLENYLLRDYDIFSAIPLNNLQVSVCFRLERQGSVFPAPTACKNPLVQRVADADVFWYDDVRNATLAFTVMQNGAQVAICPNQSSCSIQLAVPPTPTITDTPLATITPNASPTPLGGGIGEIAFLSNRDGNFGFYLMNIDGSNVRLLMTQYSEMPIVWSPDGSQFALTASSNGNFDIYLMNADGSNPHNITNSPANEGERGIAWSPDGTQIAYAYRNELNHAIYRMNADGSNPHPLVNMQVAAWRGLAWSPDGSQIVFVAHAGDNSEIYLMSADGSNPHNITNNQAQDEFPSWSPDGSQIAFASTRDGNHEIYLMSADGSNPHNITNDPAEDAFPTWSPDGTQIAFTSGRGDNYDIYLMNADGSDPRNLTNSPSGEDLPAWRPAPKS